MAGPGPDGGPIKVKQWRWIAGVTALAVAAAVLFLIRWRNEGFDWRLFGRTLIRLNWGWLLGAALFAVASYYGRALRWSAMIRPYKPEPNLWGLFTSTAIGFTAVFLLGRPAEFVRPYLISVKERVPLSSQLAAWLLERIFDLLTVLLIFGFALTQVDRSALTLGPGLQWLLRAGGFAVALLCTLSLGIVLLFRHFSSSARRRFLDAVAFLPPHYHQKVEQITSAFAEGMAATRQDSALLLVFAYTLLEWLLISASYICMFRAFPGLAGLTTTDVFIFLGFVSFGGVVQIPGIGGGVQIATVVVLTELFRLPLELAGSVALICWFLTFVVISPIGLVLLFHEGMNFRRIKEIEEQATI
jgi:hypothetical protein